MDVNQTDIGSVLYRVNAGDSLPQDVSGWDPDGPSPFLSNAGSGNLYSTNGPITLSHPSVPAGSSEDLFKTERYDADTDTNGEMEWEFPIAAGAQVEVRVFLAEIFIIFEDDQTNNDKVREFDIAIEDQVFADFDDVNVYDAVGHDAGLVLDAVVTVGVDDVLGYRFPAWAGEPGGEGHRSPLAVCCSGRGRPRR